MRLWTIPLRLLGILALAALVSGAWLFRTQIVHLVRPTGARGSAAGASRPASPSGAGLVQARDKIDSLNGWKADSVVLTAAETAALIRDGLPPEIGRRLDSLAVTLVQDGLVVSARLETAGIPPDALGPLAGAVEAWERIRAEGPLVVIHPGQAEWRVRRLTLRGFSLPEASAQALLDRALPGVRRGVIPLALAPGVSRVRIRPGGVSFFREDSR